MRILEPLERERRPLARGGVFAHAGDQRLERVEVVACRRGAQAVVEGVLPQGAVRPIDRGEDLIEIEVLPGAIVERSAGGVRDPRGMRFGHRVEPAGALDGLLPFRTKPRQAAPASACDQAGDGHRHQRGNDNPEKGHGCSGAGDRNGRVPLNLPDRTPRVRAAAGRRFPLTVDKSAAMLLSTVKGRNEWASLSIWCRARSTC